LFLHQNIDYLPLSDPTNWKLHPIAFWTFRGMHIWLWVNDCI
jgi:hypothetical protein